VERCRIRAGPAIDAEEVGILARGQEIVVLEKVALDEGRLAFCATSRPYVGILNIKERGDGSVDTRPSYEGGDRRDEDDGGLAGRR
jgi:hypothetical protein